MHDGSAGEPQPRRRSALRHALGGLALLVVLAINLVLLDHAGITNWGSWTRHLRAQLGGGRAGMRKQVSVGMTRREVEARIGEGEYTFVSVCYLIKPCGGPVPDSARFTPSARVAHREYGFSVVYHCHDMNDQDNWTVSAVEDLE